MLSNVLDEERVMRMARRETTLLEEKFVVRIHAVLVYPTQNLTWSQSIDWNF